MEVMELDEVRQEEEKKLVEVENKIDSIASKYEKETQKLSKELQGFECYDYEDRDRRMYIVRNRDSARKEADKFRGFQDSPYFARMEFENSEDNDDCFEIFVGSESIGEYADIIVVDWRSPVGQTYYAKSQKDFKINDYRYTLLLRRALEIKKSKLVSYDTEYDVSAVGLEGEVVDSFLLKVLKDKRRQTHLTNIIRTIQQNQNDIIRRPISISIFIRA